MPGYEVKQYQAPSNCQTDDLTVQSDIKEAYDTETPDKIEGTMDAERSKTNAMLFYGVILSNSIGSIIIDHPIRR